MKLAYRLSSLYSKHLASQVFLLSMKIGQDILSIKHIGGIVSEDIKRGIQFKKREILFIPYYLGEV